MKRRERKSDRKRDRERETERERYRETGIHRYIYNHTEVLTGKRRVTKKQKETKPNEDTVIMM